MEHRNEPANSYEDAEDALSLRDLPINAVDSLSSSPRTSISATLDLFDFSFDTYRSEPTDIIFPGQIVAYNDHYDSACFSNSPSFRRDNYRFASARIDSSSAKVNITSLTSMSAKSRRRMFMFGPVKFKPEMELSAIRERQGRRTTTPSSLFPVAVVGGGGGGGSDETAGNGVVKGMCSHSSHWGIVRSLRCRAQRDYLSTILARSLGCIPSH